MCFVFDKVSLCERYSFDLGCDVFVERCLSKCLSKCLCERCVVFDEVFVDVFVERCLSKCLLRGVLFLTRSLCRSVCRNPLLMFTDAIHYVSDTRHPTLYVLDIPIYTIVVKL
jgi:hypothetical protein